MSISTTSTKDSYAGNASITTQYPITFKYLEESHVSVYIDGVLQTKGAGADYVMGGDGTTNTGYITTNVAQADTKTITIVLDVTFDQPVDLQETGVLSSSTLEEAYDRLNMQIRRVWRKAQSVLTFSTDEGGAGSQGTADNLIGFDGTGNLTEIPNATFALATDNSTDVTLSGTGTQASMVDQALTINKITAGDINSESATVGQVLQSDGDTTCSFVDLAGGGNAQTFNPLSQFASTTSAEFAGVISDETGTGSVVLANSPTLITPALGTPSAIDLTNATNIPLPVSSTTTEGIVELATQSEVNGGVDTSRAVTPATLASYSGLAQGVTVSDTAPTLPADGSLWYNSTTGITYLYYNDGTSSQWVSAHPTITSPADPTVTGTATFTNSTNNISLTGIGNLDGLAVGDVIEVAGSVSNNDVFTVEVITDTNNVIVNAAHAGGTTSKSLTTEASGGVKVTLVCKAKDAPLGYGQGVVDVLSSRSSGSVYTNTTGRSLHWVSSYASTSATSNSGNFEVDGISMVSLSSSSLRELTPCLVIPNGSSYEYTLTGSGNINHMSELR
jgi:hypothetical protein